MSKDSPSTRSRRRGPTFERILRIMHQTHKRVFQREKTAWSLLFREISHQGIEAFEHRAPVVWTTSYVFPMELIAAAGLIPVDFELYAGLMSAANQTAVALRAADQAAVPQDTCTVHRVAIGAALLNQFPSPDLLISTSHYCDGKAKTNEFMANHYGVEYHLLDMPLEDTPHARTYLESQLWAIFEKLCRLGGRRADEGLLADPIRQFNAMTGHLKRVNEIRRETPSPLLSDNGGFTLSFLATLLHGTSEAVEIYRRLERGFQEARADGTIPPESKRLLWLMASPTYPAPIFSLLEELGGRIVMEELSHCYWEALDEGTPIPSIARRMLANTFMGPVTRRAETTAMLARQYRADAALHFGHLPCRQANGALQIIKDRLAREGIRLINLEADLNDPTNFPEDRIRDQLLTYWEILVREGGTA